MIQRHNMFSNMQNNFLGMKKLHLLLKWIKTAWVRHSDNATYFLKDYIDNDGDDINVQGFTSYINEGFDDEEFDDEKFDDKDFDDEETGKMLGTKHVHNGDILWLIMWLSVCEHPVSLYNSIYFNEIHCHNVTYLL